MEHPPPLAYPSLRIVRISPAALAAGMETSQQGSALVRVISAAKTEAGGKVSRRKARRVIAASRVHARGSRKILLTRRVARQDRLRSVRSNRLLPFTQQMVRHELLRFAYCIAVGGTPTNCAPSLVEQRGALERTAFSAFTSASVARRVAARYPVLASTTGSDRKQSFRCFSPQAATDPEQTVGLLKAAVARTRPRRGSSRSISSNAILARRAVLQEERPVCAGWGPSASGHKRP